MLIVSSISVTYKLILTTLVLTRYLEIRTKHFFIANFPLCHPRGKDQDSLKYMSQAMRKCVLYHMRTTKYPRSLISTFVVRSLDSIYLYSFYIWNFKPLASFCGCSGRFVCGLVGNSRTYVLSCLIWKLLFLFNTFKHINCNTTFYDIKITY